MASQRPFIEPSKVELSGARMVHSTKQDLLMLLLFSELTSCTTFLYFTTNALGQCFFFNKNMIEAVANILLNTIFG